jgi:hypothetical protein
LPVAILMVAAISACRPSSLKSPSYIPVSSAPIEQTASQMDDTTLCSFAINTDGPASTWFGVPAITWDITMSSHIAEIQLRGISLWKCASLTGNKYNGNSEVARRDYERKLKLNEKEAKDRRIRLEQEEHNRKLEAERQRKAEAERQRKAEAERIRVAKLKQAKKHKAEERRQRELVRERKILDAHEREMLPIRRKNRNSFAVIIGNRNYSGRVPTVDFAHNDADAMKRFIITKLGYREGNIFDLRDAGVNAISALLGNEKSHKGTLFNALRKGQSDVIVYYSGHGVPGLEDERPYLLPVDGDPNSAEITGYSVDTMYANLAKLPARSVTVFLDACFSGESEKGMLVSSASGISVNPKMPSSKGQMTVITAAQGNQLASWDPKARHGLFTKHLLDALNGEADGKGYGNDDGKVSLSEIQNYLDDEMTYQARATWKRQQNAYVRGSGNTILSTVFRVP